MNSSYMYVHVGTIIEFIMLRYKLILSLNYTLSLHIQCISLSAKKIHIYRLLSLHLKADLIKRNFRSSDKVHIMKYCFSIQAGVFVSQSSLPIGKIQRVGLLTVIQTVNMLVWIINDRVSPNFNITSPNNLRTVVKCCHLMSTSKTIWVSLCQQCK